MVNNKYIETLVFKYLNNKEIDDIPFYNEEIINDVIEFCKVSNNDTIKYSLQGYCYEQDKNNLESQKKAFELYSIGATKNDPFSVFNLGRCYEYAIGLDFVDYAKAYDYYLKSAELGYYKALFKVAFFNFYGIYVDENKEEGIKYFIKSSKAGCGEASYVLGLLSYKGILKDADDLKAYNYFSIAGKQGYNDGYYLANMLVYEGLIPETEKLKKTVFETSYKLSNEGHANSYLMLGFCYFYAYGTERNLKEAYKYFDLSAEFGNKRAIFMKGTCLRRGLGTIADFKKSISCFKLLFNADDIEFQKDKTAYYSSNTNDDELIYEEEKPTKIIIDTNEENELLLDICRSLTLIEYDNLYEKSLKEQSFGSVYYENTCEDLKDGDAVYDFNDDEDEEEDSENCFTVEDVLRNKWIICDAFENAEFLKTGDGEEYKKAAFNDYKKAASEDNHLSYYRLAECYEYGFGTRKNKSLAMKNYIAAASFNIETAQLRCATYFENGYLTEKNESKASAYYYQLAKNHLDTETLEIEKMYFDYFNSYEIGGNVNYFIFKQAQASHNFVVGKYLLAYAYFNGIDTNKNYHLAYVLSKEAAEEGDVLAANLFGKLNYYGFGCPKNYKIAFEYFMKGIDSEYSEPFYNLAVCYENGNGISKDLEKALSFYEKADELLHPNAKENIERIEKYLVEKTKYKDINLINKKDVFISWNHADLGLKNRLKKSLEQNKICSVWESDGDGIGELDKILKAAIKSSKAFVVIVSGNTLQSEWVKKELSCIKEIIDKNRNKINTLVPIVINRIKNEDEISSNYNVRDAIRNLDDNSPFRLVLDCSCIFIKDEINLNEVNINKKITYAIENYAKIEYSDRIKKKYSTFNASLSNNLASNNFEIKNTINKFINATLSFSANYLDRDLVTVNGEKVSPKELLNSKNVSLIYGSGGSGKSLYLKNLCNKYFVKNNYIFYLPTNVLTKELQQESSFLKILKMKCFDSLFEDIILTEDSFKNIFIENNNCIILIDALDELDDNLKFKLLERISEFLDKNNNIKLIFTSRNINDSVEISKALNLEVDTYELCSLTDEEVNKLYMNIKSTVFENQQLSIEKIDKDFFVYLEYINDDIKRNPMLLSNLIYVYLITNEIPKKQFEIIDKSSKLLIDSLEKESDIRFEYNDLISGNRLVKLLGYLALKRAQNSTEDTIEIFKDYFSLNNCFKDGDDELAISESIYTYLCRKNIIINDNISHEIFRDYYAACYIFDIHIKKVTDLYGDTNYSYISNKTKDHLETLIEKKMSDSDTPWPTISSDFITKLDFEIYNLDNRAIMNEENPNYYLFNDVLSKSLVNENGFSKQAKFIIKSLVEERLLYFINFIGSYLK